MINDTQLLRHKFVMGNWKMHGTHASIHALIQQIKSIQISSKQNVVIFPPYVYLEKVAWELRNSELKWGAQNVSAYSEGAYTGEISSRMLKDLNCTYTLIGHSERRQYFGETNDIIIEKIYQASHAGLKPVLCVGETLSNYQSHQTQQKVLAQIKSVLKSPKVLPYLDKLIIAYEPIWAIGTGLTATVDKVQKVHQFIREIVAEADEEIAINLPILYGGSVKGSNAKELFNTPDVDGVLVGGASLVGEEFQKICHSME